jgi:hypothetical protein
MEKLFSTIRSLRAMIAEMNHKNLDLKRITKTASLLICSGLSTNSIPAGITRRCVTEQHEDGGWVSIVDTLWNAYFLKLLGSQQYKLQIDKAKSFLLSQINDHGLWGRSPRDISRIPITGILFYLFPDLANGDRLLLLEELWQSEKKSITYKAAYTLMAFNATGYSPKDKTLTRDTVEWLMENQRPDGSFAPWKTHPVASDVFCTSVAVLGLLQYKESVLPETFDKSYSWLLSHRLSSVIWPYHEIEDGASWALYTLTQLLKHNMVSNG